jgi:hypothetical protein
MRNSLSVLFAGCLLLVMTGLARPGSDPSPNAIIAKVIKAMGGEANLAKHKAATWTEKGTYYGMGDGLPFTAKYSMQMPDKFRMEIPDVFTIVYAGDKGWIGTAGNTKEMTAMELAAQTNDHRAGFIALVLPLKDKAFTLKAVPGIKVEGRPAVGIQVTRKDYPEVKLYFDAETHLPARMVWPSKAAEEKFKDVTAEMLYSKYKEIDGVQVPTHLVLKRDGKLFVEADVSDHKAVGKLDDKVFAKP